VRRGHSEQLVARLRKCDIEAGFAKAHAFEQVLQRESGFAHARITLEQIKPVGGDTATQHIIEAGNPCGAANRRNSGRCHESA
jgi:hypothetical protein